MPNIITASRAGTVFEVENPTQMVIETINKTRNFKNGSQEIILENLTINSILTISSSDIGLNKPEIITNSSCLFLQPGIYRWSQTIRFENGNPPSYITPDNKSPFPLINFGIGGPATLEFVNEGINNIITVTSAEQGRKVFVKGKIIYDLLDGEQISAIIDVVNMTNGQVLSTGQTLIEGEDADEIDIEVHPFIISAGHNYRISFSIINSGLKPAKCILIQKGEIIN